MSLSDTGFAVFQKFSRCDVAIKRHDSIFPEMSDPGLRSVVACTETWSGQNIIVRHAHNTVEILFCLSHFNFFLFTSTNENVRLSRYIYIWTHSHFFFPFLCCSALRKIVFRLDFRNCDIPRKLKYRAKLLFFFCFETEIYHPFSHIWCDIRIAINININGKNWLEFLLK